jgi:iron complex transport system permease protein
MKANKKTLIVVSILLFAFLAVLNLSIGAVKVGFGDIFNIIISKIGIIEKDDNISDSIDYIISNVRLPRIIVSYFVGGLLSICGVAYQGLLKNPMADPYILGISSGAAFGATIGIVAFGGTKLFGISTITLFAFIGAIAVVFFVYNIARIGNRVPVTTMLLSGIAMSQFLAALMSVMMMLFDESLHKIIFWTMGSLSGKGWDQVATIIPYSIVGFLILMVLSKEMDIMLLGEENANNLGVDSEKIKKIILVITSIITGVAVSMSGIIGFVGLIVPHMVRMFTGPSHRILLPVAFNFGGVMLMCCDTVARSLISQEIPVGIITAVLGGPFFIYLLNKRKKEMF